MKRSRANVRLSGVLLCAAALLTAQQGWAQIVTVVTPPGPRITGGLFAGSTSVTGTATPDPNCGTTCNGVEIFTCTPGNCSPASATPISNPVFVCPDVSGNFTEMVPALLPGQFIFAYDSCADVMGPLYRVPLPPAAPALSSTMTAMLAGVLALIGLFGLRRLRRDL
jgi:hypothetical protein